jgi:uncharacterized protein (DUF1330 family)
MAARSQMNAPYRDHEHGSHERYFCFEERIMSAYVISIIRVDDPEVYQQYTARTPTTVKAHGGKFLARGGTVQTVEGDPFRDRLVILEFPSREAVSAWYTSPEYQEARQYRVASSEATILVIEGTSGEDAPDPKVVKTG